MSKIMLVAGDKTPELVEYFNRRDALQVVHASTSLTADEFIFRTKIIKVDKLVYVYQDNSINIRNDMQVLSNLLSNENAFFSVKEIVFFIKVTEDTKKGLEYFKSIMEDCHFTNYRIEQSTKQLAFLKIYDNLMGLSKNAGVENTFKKQYRIERGSKVKNVYEPDNDTHIVEPFNYSELEKYSKAKTIVDHASSDLAITDDNDGVNLDEQQPNPYLGEIKVKEFLENRNIFVTSGLEKSGSTTLTALLAQSCLTAGKSLSIINLTESEDLEFYLDAYDIDYTCSSLSNVMLNKRIEVREGISVIEVSEYKPDIKLSAIRYIIGKLSKLNSDIIIIEADLDEVSSLIPLLGFKLNRIFLTCENIDREINKLGRRVGSIKGEFTLMILLKSILESIVPVDRLSGTDSKMLIETNFGNIDKEKLKVVTPIDLKDVEIDDTLYKSFMEVKYEFSKE